MDFDIPPKPKGGIMLTAAVAKGAELIRVHREEWKRLKAGSNIYFTTHLGRPMLTVSKTPVTGTVEILPSPACLECAAIGVHLGVRMGWPEDEREKINRSVDAYRRRMFGKEVERGE